MKRIIRFFLTRKLLRKELAKQIRQNEYLRASRLKYRQREEGYRELINIYSAVIVLLGEELIKSGKLGEGQNYDERMGNVIALLKNNYGR